jgi:hypothetical protein
MSRAVKLLVALALALVSLPLVTAAGGTSNAAAAAAEHQRIIDFWTPERVAQAVPRDFVRLADGTFSPAKGGPGGSAGKPGGGTSSGITGAHWTAGGMVAKASGKVLFAMDGSYWICSASVLKDSQTNTRSIVVTAGHCVYDETNGAFATNWMYIPDYDAAPAPLNTSGTFCSSTAYGCWTAESLVVGSGFADAGGFNTQATLNDWGFAVVGLGGKDGTFVESLGAQNYSWTSVAANGSVTGWAFGYPAEKKYNGSQLIYCSLPITADPYNSNDTYKLDGCKLNGGSSGGPWYRNFSTSAGTGTLVSLNSYGYNGITAIHGPMFNTKTAAAYNAALTADGDTIVP